VFVVQKLLGLDPWVFFLFFFFWFNVFISSQNGDDLTRIFG
jgi:hypothetical protein